MSSRAIFAASVVVACGLLGGYLAAGGGKYRPLEPEDPCRPRPIESIRGGADPLEQIALSALDGAACRLRVTREELALALATAESRERFAREHRISDRELEEAVRAGIDRAAADAERSGRLSPLQVLLLRKAANRLPIGVLLEVLRSEPGRGAAELLEDLIRGRSP